MQFPVTSVNPTRTRSVPSRSPTRDEKPMQMAVAVVNYNTRDLLRTCLETVRAESPRELVVVDNASTDGSAGMVRMEFPEVYLVANTINPGYGTAANQAVAHCSAPYVLLLNGDTCVQPGTLRALRLYLDAHPEAAIVGPHLLNPDGTLQPSSFPFPTPLHMLVEETTLGRRIGRIPVLRDRYLRTWSHLYARIVPWVMGAALAIRREAFDAVGGFDESFYLYFEEVDLCYRLATAGWQVHFSPDASVVHVGRASTSQRRSNMHAQFFAGMAHFYRRHYPQRKVIELMVVVKSLMLVKWIRDAVRLRLTGDVRQRTELVENLATWRSILFGQAEEHVK